MYEIARTNIQEPQNLIYEIQNTKILTFKIPNAQVINDNQINPSTDFCNCSKRR